MKVTPKHILAILTTTASVFLAVTPSTQAASITWGAATNISGDTDVSITGTLVNAFTVGDSGVSGSTVNGVAFQGFVAPFLSNVAINGNYSLVGVGGDFLSNNTIFGSSSAPFSALSAAYKNILNSATEVAQPDTLFLTMTGLTIGTIYQFQWWSNLSGPTLNAAQGLQTASAGNSVTTSDNTSGLEGGLGQFAIGTFVADATSQSVVFSSPTGGSTTAAATLNAFQLRNLGASVPETASLLAGLLPFGVLLLGRFSRRSEATAGKV